jgi:hypothetical protein
VVWRCRGGGGAAYNVLGNASKRAVYDRDHGFHTAQHTSPGQTHTHQRPMGSHSSYAGSRPEALACVWVCAVAVWVVAH